MNETENGVAEVSGVAEVPGPAEPPAVSVPRAIREEAEGLAKVMVASTKATARQNIAYYTRYITQETEKLAAAEERAAAEAALWAEAMTLLKRAGFKPVAGWRFRITVETTAKRLPALYRAIGRLDGKNAEKEVADGAAGTVKVSLYSVKYPDVKVVFVRKLAPSDPCKIEKREVPARTEYNLVCDRR